MTPNEAYTIVVEECGAPENHREYCVSWLSGSDGSPPKQNEFEFEFRFQGKLGFGGKLWRTRKDKYKVTYYPEDKTPERDAMIQRANARLQEEV